MKKLLLLLPLLLATPAKSEMIQTPLTACTSADAAEAYTRHVYIDKEDPQKILNELGDMCKLTFRVFELGPEIKKFTDGKLDYSIVTINVVAEGSDGGNELIVLTAKSETLYTVHYELHDDGI